MLRDFTLKRYKELLSAAAASTYTPTTVRGLPDVAGEAVPHPASRCGPGARSCTGDGAGGAREFFREREWCV